MASIWTLAPARQTPCAPLVCFLHFPLTSHETFAAMPTDAPHRLLLDNLNTATLLLDERLCLEYMNPAAEMLLAVSRQRSHGQFISELFTETPEALAALRHAIERAHPFTKREATLLTLAGQPVTVDYAITPIVEQGRNRLLMEVHPRDRLLRITNTHISSREQ